MPPFRASIIPLAAAGLFAAACGADLTLPTDHLPAELVAVSGDAQAGAPGTRLPDPLIVEVRDAQGRPVEGVPVAFRFTRAATGASVAPGSVTTGPDGRAAAKVVLPTSTGDQVVEAALSGDGVPNLSASFLLTARAVSGGGTGGGGDGGGGQDGGAAPGDGDGRGHGHGHDEHD